MAIKDIGSFQQTLGNADARGWSRKVDHDMSTGFDIKAPGLEGGNVEGGKTFGEFLQDSIGKVNALQQDANVAMEKLASGESQNLHETLLAVEKADIAFRTMNQVRSKVLDAYREIMKMQI
ncbi:flagellar hook-basal body complex protein FliE [Peredibacter sp. HCB2-198]|uniref:flagellar hook-basal body complex protein FliE n=1 Tax=Peredibacter sp. HCB2-198 TaxID=3383025 RepID=UPI0038B6212B